MLTQTESSVLSFFKTASWHFFILCLWWTGFYPLFFIVDSYSVSKSINEYSATHNEFLHGSKGDRVRFLAVIPTDVHFQKIAGTICPNIYKTNQALAWFLAIISSSAF